MALRGDTRGFLRAVGVLSWGLMLTVFALSHMAMLLTSGEVYNPVAGGVGLLFFLVMLTQFNDVAQYTWAKLLGRHQVMPQVRPKKTWEGLPHRERLPKDGPAVLAANHNSNLDALALISLMPLRLLPKLRPVAAIDYFFTSKTRSWFVTNIIGIIPVKRGSGKEDGKPLPRARLRSTAARFSCCSRKARAAIRRFSDR
jgi:hypothetical protein